MSFAARLREERKKLGLIQADLAEKTGITKKAQGAYEKDRLPQFAEYLEALARTGIDVAYVLTGERGGVQLTKQEADMLALMRQAPPAVRETALNVLRSGLVISKQVNVGRDLHVEGDFRL